MRQALPTTAVVLENDSLVYLPRYDKFAAAVMSLAKEGKSFKQIAGNGSAILITVLVPADHNNNFVGAQTIFHQLLASNPALKRVAITVPVGLLHQLLLKLEKEQIKLEHVFDY